MDGEVVVAKLIQPETTEHRGLKQSVYEKYESASLRHQ
jgi:hypothetical protein